MEMNAEQGVRRLMKTADIVVLIPNDMVLDADPELSLDTAFEAVDKIIIRGIKSILESFSSLDASASP